MWRKTTTTEILCRGLLIGMWIWLGWLVLPQFCFAGGFLLHSHEEMTALRQDGRFLLLQESRESIIREATGILRLAPLAVTDKIIPGPSGDIHDFVSLSIYYWPDRTRGDGLPYVRQDGLVNPEKSDAGKYDADRLSKTVSRVERLAVAYYLTGEEKYAQKAAELLQVFFLSPKTRMNPHLSFAQGVPGKSTGTPSGIIETVVMIRLADALEMLSDSSSWSPADRKDFCQWLASYLDWLRQSRPGLKEQGARNNHGVWYDAQCAVFAHMCGRTDLVKEILAKVPNERIYRQIEPDGRMPAELARTKAVSYTAYNLKAFITLARLGQQYGVDLMGYESPDGRSIGKGLQYFLQQVQPDTTGAYQQIVPYQDKEMERYLYLANILNRKDE